ncbi:MAG: type II secretion system protein [Parcubacteria group bacterium]
MAIYFKNNRRANNLKSKAGFTLIEIMVTTAILVFLMSAIWSSGSFRGSDFSVMISQEKLRLLMTRAKSMTINSIFGTGVDSCGYGIRIEANRAFIFLDKGTCNGGSNQTYDPGEEVTGSVNSISLTEGLTFIPSTGETAEVVFIPPNPRVVINNSETEELTVQVKSPTGLSRKVIINRQGLINLSN